MNVQNLSRNITDLVSCTKHLQLNCIAVRLCGRRWTQDAEVINKVFNVKRGL